MGSFMIVLGRKMLIFPKFIYRFNTNLIKPSTGLCVCVQLDELLKNLFEKEGVKNAQDTHKEEQGDANSCK